MNQTFFHNQELTCFDVLLETSLPPSLKIENVLEKGVNIYFWSGRSLDNLNRPKTELDNCEDFQQKMQTEHFAKTMDYLQFHIKLNLFPP